MNSKRLNSRKFSTIEKSSIDQIALYCILILQFIGLAILFSASTVTSQREFNDPYYLLKKQSLWALISFIAFTLFINFSYENLKKISLFSILFSILLLILVFIPGLGRSVDTHYGRNFNRWVNLGFIQFQPSEFAKIAVVLYVSHILYKFRQDDSKNLKYFVPPAVLVGIVVALIFFEPAYSSSVEIILLVGLLFFLDGFPIGKLFLSIIAITPILLVLVVSVGYRKKRIDVWLNPYDYRFDEGHQSVSSFKSFMEGGFFGNPLSTGYSHRYLTYSHTDFVLATFVEDYGFIGFILLSGLFFFLLFRFTQLLKKVTDPFGFLLGAGLLSVISIQIIVNMYVVTGIFPITGISLPFLSYGGSSLLTIMISLGILLNITKSENRN
jgi:cell division protein FtsW